MDSFSYWHLAIFAPIILGFIGAALNRGDKQLTRGPFVLRVVLIFVAGSAMAYFIEDDDASIGVALAYIAAVWLLIPYWAVSRLRDIGDYKKYKAVLTAVPVIGVFYTLYLFVARSEEGSGTPPIVSLGSRHDEKDESPNR